MRDYEVNMVAVRAGLERTAARLRAQVEPAAPTAVGPLVSAVLALEDVDPGAVRGLPSAREVALPLADWRLIAWALQSAAHASHVPAFAGDPKELLK